MKADTVWLVICNSPEGWRDNTACRVIAAFWQEAEAWKRILQLQEQDPYFNQYLTLFPVQVKDEREQEDYFARRNLALEQKLR